MPDDKGKKVELTQTEVITLVNLISSQIRTAMDEEKIPHLLLSHLHGMADKLTRLYPEVYR